jgi:NADH-quinone oxidoreductase subunit I
MELKDRRETDREMTTLSPIQEYFGTVWNSVKTTLVGMGVTGKYFLSKPVTLQYPDEKPEIADGFRGIHVYEIERCIACDQCANACPVDCITIESTGKGKNAVITRYEIDYNRCMFCGFCVEPCPTDCIHMGKSFDLTRFSSDECVIDFAALAQEGKQSPTGERVLWLTEPDRK